MKKTILLIATNKFLVMDKLEASFEREDERMIELEPDFDFTAYGGLSDKEYPIWQIIDLRDYFLFLHKVSLEDYGYYVEGEVPEGDFPKYTSGSHGHGEAGILNLKLAFVDRFGCRLIVRGHLKGSSAEMSLDVRLRIRIRGYAREGWLGYVGEAVAEGYAFGEEGRHKQEFFQYFSALDSYINMQAKRHNANLGSKKEIKETERLVEKFTILVKEVLKSKSTDLKQVKIWSQVKSKFKRLVVTRNAIAHNVSTAPITKMDAEECFSLLAIAVAMLNAGAFSETEIVGFFAIT